MKLQGIFVAATTPFDHTGSVYKVKVQHNIEKWNRTTLAGYVIAGATGEGPLLSHDDKFELWELAAKYADPEKVLIAACGAEGVNETEALISQAEKLRYRFAVIDAPQRYDRPESILIYFRAVADRAAIPVIIAGAEVRLAAELSHHPNIAGAVANDCCGLLAAAKPGFQVLAGSASALWESLNAGATGAILDFANAAPYATIAIWEAHRTREEEAGRDWQQRIAGPSELITGDYGIAALKHVMDLNGYYGGPPRLPLTVPAQETRHRLEEAFLDLRG
jgi:4-hydroxy-2-oxoglutarate aldolase